MATYVDELRSTQRCPGLRFKITCHLMADNDAELEKMAQRLGLKPEWRHDDHYDLSATKRTQALRGGAFAVPKAALVRLRQRKRATAEACR